MKKKILLTFIIANLTIALFATTLYVSPSGSETPPYNSLATAAKDIQTAIAACSGSELVLVDDGTYLLSSNISITIGVTLESINGSSFAIIDGNNTTRCFYINHTDAVVDGFTIKNGYNPGGFGGGVDISTGGTVQNCIIQNNQARDGAGIAIDNTGLVQNCIIKNNIASNNGTSGYGGGIRFLNGGEARNCLITENSSIGIGGGVNIWIKGSVINCTISKNTAPANKGSGIRLRGTSIIKNNIIYFNTNDDNFNINSGTHQFLNNCTTPALPSGSGNITPDPSFINTTNEEHEDYYHLSTGSACIDKGLDDGWVSGDLDLDGNARIYGPHVDMGCYEYNTPAIIDDDGDSIANDDDDFPDDPDRAFLNYFPAAGFGSLAFEDLWPGKGDYDFNDVVVDYRFATVTNANDFVVDITATFVAKASGAFFHNGFGFELTTADNGLKTDLTVTGFVHQESYINVDGNGLEEGQDHPTVIVFDDIFNLLPHPNIGLGVNTEDWTPFVPFNTINVVLTPTQNTFDANDFDLLEWNPFIIVNMDRDYEVHLINKPPTDLADESIFGTVEDDSDLGNGRYYVTANNLPWAIDVPSSFDWPKEKIEVTQAYHKFIEWAESLGQDYGDWYLDLPGYRNSSYIYEVPTP